MRRLFTRFQIKPDAGRTLAFNHANLQHQIKRNGTRKKMVKKKAEKQLKSLVNILMRTFLWDFMGFVSRVVCAPTSNSSSPTIFNAHLPISRSLMLIVYVYDNESAIIFFCWTFKSAGQELIDERFSLCFIKNTAKRKRRRKKAIYTHKLSRWIS